MPNTMRRVSYMRDAPHGLFKVSGQNLVGYQASASSTMRFLPSTR